MSEYDNMSARDYRIDLGTRLFFGALVALFWSFCILGLVLDDVRNDVGLLLGLVFLFSLTLPLVNGILWRLCVDEHGVTQTVYGWNVYWPWKVFESGAVEKYDKRSYIRADWPWWRIGRKLHLPIDLEDRDEVKAIFDRLIINRGGDIDLG